jgi:hypothetical protein
MLGLLILAAAAAHASGVGELPQAVKAELARVETSAQRSRTFRTLLAENDGIERRLEALPGGDFVRFQRGPRRLAYDPARLKKATEWEVQTATTRELAKAALPLPVTLVESEAAAWVRALSFVLELAIVDRAFSKALAERALKSKNFIDKSEDFDAWARVKTADGGLVLPPDELERVALFAAALAHGPDRFYEAVGQLSSLGRDVSRLSEVADLLQLHGALVAKAQPRAGQAFTVVAGARYPTRVVLAAQALLPEGGSEYAREVLGTYEADAAGVSKRLRAWLKWEAP